MRGAQQGVGEIVKDVIIYTDGDCSGNPGVGGWCAILMHGGAKEQISGHEAATTNNMMELMAVIMGLKALKYKCNVAVYSDSAYVCNAVENGWLQDWINNGWRTAGKKDVKNVDLWQELLRLMNMHTVCFVKVKGHSDNEYNNACDKVARAEISAFKKLAE